MEKSEGNTLINTRWLITNEKYIYIRKNNLYCAFKFRNLLLKKIYI